jgi:hypothetical protein
LGKGVVVSREEVNEKEESQKTMVEKGDGLKTDGVRKRERWEMESDNE